MRPPRCNESSRQAYNVCINAFSPSTLHKQESNDLDCSGLTEPFHKHRELRPLAHGTAEHRPLQTGRSLPLDFILSDSQLELEGAHKCKKQRLHPACGYMSVRRARPRAERCALNDREPVSYARACSAQESHYVGPRPGHLLCYLGDVVPAFRTKVKVHSDITTAVRATENTYLKSKASSPQMAFERLIARIGMCIQDPFSILVVESVGGSMNTKSRSYIPQMIKRSSPCINAWFV